MDGLIQKLSFPFGDPMFLPGLLIALGYLLTIADLSSPSNVTVELSGAPVQVERKVAPQEPSYRIYRSTKVRNSDDNL